MLTAIIAADFHARVVTVGYESQNVGQGHQVVLHLIYQQRVQFYIGVDSFIIWGYWEMFITSMKRPLTTLSSQ